MKNNYLHTGNTTKKSSARARPVFRAFAVVAAVTLAGVALRVALAAGPEHLSVRSNKSQIVAENPDASNNHGIAMRSGKNPIAEKYDTLVMRVYFRDRAERDRLAQELNAEEVPTTGGYLTILGDRDLYYGLTARGLRVEIDENSSRNLSDPQILRDTFYGGYKTVEEIYAFLDEKVAQFPNLVRSEEHTSELQSPYELVCRLLLEKKKKRSVRRCRRRPGAGPWTNRRSDRPLAAGCRS